MGVPQFIADSADVFFFFVFFFCSSIIVVLFDTLGISRFVDASFTSFLIFDSSEALFVTFFINLVFCDADMLVCQETFMRT